MNALYLLHFLIIEFIDQREKIGMITLQPLQDAR